MKKALFLVALMFISASVFGMRDSSQTSQGVSEQNQKLADTLRLGNFDQVVQAIDDGTDVNGALADGATPLIFAVDTNNHDLVSILLGLGADVNGKSNDGRTALTVAIYQKNDKILDILLHSDDIDLEAIGMMDLSPLGVAMEMDAQAIDLDGADPSYVKLTEKLLKAGAKADGVASKENRDTALMRAVMYGKESMVKLLIKNGANLHAKNRYGDTALALAAKGGWLEGFELLKPLEKQYYAGIFLNVYKNKQAMSDNQIDGLVLKSSDIDEQNNNGYTPLISALESGHPKTAEWLINHGANVNLQNKSGRTALMFAARKGYTEIVKLLLKKGARVNLTDKEGISAQWLAAEEGHKDIAQMLDKKTSD